MIGGDNLGPGTPHMTLWPGPGRGEESQQFLLRSWCGVLMMCWWCVDTVLCCDTTLLHYQAIFSSHLVWDLTVDGGSDLVFLLPSFDVDEGFSVSEAVLGFGTFLLASLWRADEVLATLLTPVAGDLESFWAEPGFWGIGFFLPPETDGFFTPDFVDVLTFFFPSASAFAYKSKHYINTLIILMERSNLGFLYVLASLDWLAISDRVTLLAG